MLLNLLGAVSLCRVFLQSITCFDIYLFCRICWPFGADQPAAAAHITENLNVAFELVQVRTRHILQPMHRNGLAPQGTREAVGIEIRQTIDLCRGEKGQEIRKNAEEFKVRFAKAWDDDGPARREMHDFLAKYELLNI